MTTPKVQISENREREKTDEQYYRLIIAKDPAQYK